MPKEDTHDDPLDFEPIIAGSRIRHPDEIGENWDLCHHFIAPLADEIEEWTREAAAEGLDYREPTTLDRLTYIIAGIVVDGPGSVPDAAAWWRARAWCDVNGQAEFRDRFAARVTAVWDETESLERRLRDWQPSHDSLEEDHDRAVNERHELQGFLVTVVEPFLADLRNWSRELKQRSSPATEIDVPLAERDQLVLTVLRDNSVLDSDHRMTTAEIAGKAAGKMTDPNPYKEVVSKLVELGYVATKEGRGGGCWLTPSGQKRVAKL
jgi:hypothetical protein